MSKAEDGFTEHVSAASEPGGVVKQQRGSGRFMRHCVRFWWLYALLVVVVVLVSVLLTIFVGFPHLAQSAVNGSTINITSMALLNPTPDSFDLNLVSVLGTKSAFHPELDAFNASVSLPGSASPIMSIEIPAVKSRNGAVTTITSQHITIADIEGFTKYTAAVLAMETVTLILRGRTGLKEGSLPKTTVNYHKTVTMTGMFRPGFMALSKSFNSLPNFAISSLKLLSTPQSDGTNLLADALIPNPTVQTIQLGDLALSLSIPGNGSNTPSTPIGSAHLTNVTLMPGNNTLPLRTVTNETLVLGLVQAHPTYLKGLPVDITIDNSTVNGVVIPYFTRALQANTLHVTLDLAQAI